MGVQSQIESSKIKNECIQSIVQIYKHIKYYYLIFLYTKYHRIVLCILINMTVDVIKSSSEHYENVYNIVLVVCKCVVSSW